MGVANNHTCYHQLHRLACPCTLYVHLLSNFIQLLYLHFIKVSGSKILHWVYYTTVTVYVCNNFTSMTKIISLVWTLCASMRLHTCVYTAFTLPLESEPEWYQAKDCTVLAALLAVFTLQSSWWFEFHQFLINWIDVRYCITWYWFIMAFDLWSSSVSKTTAQEGTKAHGMQLHNHDIAVMHFWDCDDYAQYWARHSCSTDLVRYCLFWQAKRW